MVEDGAADGDFRLLSMKRSGSQALFDDGLVSPDGGLDWRTPAIASCGLPLHPTVSANCWDMLIPLAGGLVVGVFDSIGTRGTDDGGRGAMVDDRVIGGRSVISAICSELSDRSIDLAEQWCHL
jgi:hypothetical protein